MVQDVLEELGLLDAPRVLVFNKTDLITHAEEEVLRERVRGIEHIPSVFLSAHRPKTLARLRNVLLARIRAFLALPVEALDESGLRHRLREIGAEAPVAEETAPCRP